MKESSLVALVKIRQELNNKALHFKEPVLKEKDQEILELKKTNLLLQERLKANEEIFTKNLSGMRHEIEARDGQILKLNTEAKSKNSSLLKLKEELARLNELLVESEKTKKALVQEYEDKMNDMKLKHDQEIFILKKIKKS